MQSKLTLSMDKELIEFAHELAKKSNSSVSQIFRTFLLNMKRRQKKFAGRHKVLEELHGICGKSGITDKREVYKTLYGKKNS